MQRVQALRQRLLAVASAQALAASPLAAVPGLISPEPPPVDRVSGHCPPAEGTGAGRRSFASRAGDYRLSKSTAYTAPAEKVHRDDGRVWDREKHALIRSELKRRVAAWTQHHRRNQLLEHGMVRPFVRSHSGTHPVICLALWLYVASCTMQDLLLLMLAKLAKLAVLPDPRH